MEAAAAGAGLTGWQAAALSGAAGWVWAASYFDLTRRARALAQPWVTRRVLAETPSILSFQVRSSLPPILYFLCFQLTDDQFKQSNEISCILSIFFCRRIVLPLLVVGRCWCPIC